LISVVVCGHNGAPTLPLLLAALTRQTLARSDFEVVYVDDASTDGSVGLVEAWGAARVVPAPEHIGLPRARNLGIAAARGDLLAFTDVDTVPDRAWLEKGKQRFDDADVDYLAGGVSIGVGERPTIAALVDATTFLDQASYVGEGFAAGANFWVRKSVAERVGGFDEDLERYGGDDEDFGWRLNAAGVRPVYAPEAWLSHPPRTRLRDVGRKSFRLGYSNAARRRSPTGQLSGRAPVFRQPRAYLPPRRLRGLHRIPQLDYVPTVSELLRMHVARYLSVQLAMLAGDLAGELRLRARPAKGPR
jgi:GT2 family glycosyltransferase